MPCAKPVDIECETVGGKDWRLTGKVFRVGCTLDGGLDCLNSDNKKTGGCGDYRVRFLCPHGGAKAALPTRSPTRHAVGPPPGSQN